MDVFDKRHTSWLCDLWQQQGEVLHHIPEPAVSFSFSSGADTWPLLSSAGRPVDSLSAVVVLTLSTFPLACTGLPERLEVWLRWLRCLALHGLGLRDPVFMRTAVPSSSELKSELSEELASSPEVGSWIWRQIKKTIRDQSCHVPLLKQMHLIVLASAEERQSAMITWNGSVTPTMALMLLL